MATTMVSNWPRTKEKRPRLFAAAQSAGLVVAQHLRTEAAACGRRVLTRPAKQLRPYISPQAYSDLHQHGGSLGSVAVLMLADPSAAQELAAHLQAVADAVSDCLNPPLFAVPQSVIPAACNHLLAMDRLEREPDDPQAVRDYIASTEDLIARLRQSLAAARRQLLELEVARRQQQ